MARHYGSHTQLATNLNHTVEMKVLHQANCLAENKNIFDTRSVINIILWVVTPHSFHRFRSNNWHCVEAMQKRTLSSFCKEVLYRLFGMNTECRLNNNYCLLMTTNLFLAENFYVFAKNLEKTELASICVILPNRL